MPTPEPSQPVKPTDYSVFYGYHVKDTVGLDKGTIALYPANDTVWLFCLRNQKPWFGMFDVKTKEQLSEWTSTSCSSLNSRPAINFNPVRLSKGYAFLLLDSTSKYIQFFLNEEGIAVPFGVREILQGGEDLFKIKEIGGNILIYHPDVLGNLYSIDGKLVVNSINISEERDNGQYFLTGFKENMTWFCFCSNEQTLQYFGIEPYERNIKLHLGYGEYEDYYVKTLSLDDFWDRLIVTDWGCVYAPSYGDRHLYKDLFLCKDGKMERMDAPAYFTLHNWYNGTFMVYEQGSVVGSTISYAVYSSDKEIVLEYEKQSQTYVDPFRSGDIPPVPVSYNEYIWNGNWGGELRIRRYSLQSSATNPIWQQVVRKVSENAKVSWTLLDSQSSIWQYRIDVLEYDGSNRQIQFSVDINTGEIKYL